MCLPARADDGSRRELSQLPEAQTTVAEETHNELVPLGGDNSFQSIDLVLDEDVADGLGGPGELGLRLHILAHACRPSQHLADWAHVGVDRVLRDGMPVLLAAQKRCNEAIQRAAVEFRHHGDALGGAPGREDNLQRIAV
jgi:hypothetical protein